MPVANTTSPRAVFRAPKASPSRTVPSSRTRKPIIHKTFGIFRGGLKKLVVGGRTSRAWIIPIWTLREELVLPAGRGRPQYCRAYRAKAPSAVTVIHWFLIGLGLSDWYHSPSFALASTSQLMGLSI